MARSRLRKEKQQAERDAKVRLLLTEALTLLNETWIERDPQPW
ncbi:MAG: hypothetical protein ACREJN_01075 [Nitrospiraceae bacterium]